MENKLFVKNLTFSTTEESLKDVFSAVGNVHSAKVVMDRNTGRSRGFGFVEMETQDLATLAIQQLDSTEVAGRVISVSLAKPKIMDHGSMSAPKNSPKYFY